MESLSHSAQSFRARDLQDLRKIRAIKTKETNYCLDLLKEKLAVWGVNSESLSTVDVVQL